MKGLIAFVAHCPEVRENQRVVVVGECPELGGWELGGALSLRPAPCGRPWWVSSEVEVNLPELPTAVSGDFESEVEINQEVHRVGVSKLNFRLVAVPDSSNGAEVSDPDNPVCLEPLNGGDFRVICLVDGLPPADRSSVGGRGNNTIHIGVEERGGEQQEREMVGISVEWGVPESVQLGLIPLHPNRQTDHPQRETVNKRGGLSCPQSESAGPTSSERRTRTDPRRMAEEISERQQTSTDSTFFPQPPAVEFRGSDRQRGCGGNSSLSESKKQEAYVKGKKEDVDFDGSDSVSSNKGLADTECDRRIPRCLPLSSTHQPPHDCRVTDHERGGGQRKQSVAVPLKRRRSESALSDVEADDGDDASGFRPADSVGGPSMRREGGVVREEKQRRLAVSLSESAPLPSELRRKRGDLVGGGMMALSKSAKTVAERASVSMVGRAFSARSAGARDSVSTAGGEMSAKSVEGRVSVSMVAFALDARSVEERASVSTAGSALSARSVEGRAFASTAVGALSARSAEGRAFVNTIAFALSARSAEGRASVSTAAGALIARSAEGRAFVSMAGSARNARNAEGRAFASTAVGALSARIAEGRAFVNTIAFALSARSAEGRAFVSMAVGALSARSAEGRAFLNTIAFVLSARSAEGRAFVSMAGSALSARSVEEREFVSTAGNDISVRNAEERAPVCIESFARTVRSAS
uniref:CBM20 domain-containing protein n=1 Tax=Chromera velia CCMP2878 TaxID=1169474 RepID=A0A0G4H5H0_9ALVE|eukprot:Cvel_5726.t1-p1 / transcript=Cvel_5726.t1 / gene=Cvel_5726 / organism=Chromera_velia_CCMP2878 / gene_product=Zinc finger protein 283, putative / transcript_product=Zinc finger protein 283, putative / location=Cvel_scaffold271:60583-62764(+) / protein_length=698 / sequence_SO=supercontig / SO=protein_coding / is_pseudo=false